MKTLVSFCLVFMLIFATGCGSLNCASNTVKGALLGGATGAVSGGIIGASYGGSTNTIQGVVIGGGIGAVTGAIAGAMLDPRKTEVSDTSGQNATYELYGYQRGQADACRYYQACDQTNEAYTPVPRYSTKYVPQSAVASQVVYQPFSYSQPCQEVRGIEGGQNICYYYPQEYYHYWY